ncbi:hypothetical protein AURDEDRAFT_146607 [Auricularia subglabra TFB-10046 SS5]|nr:hypothetical protein AURDEDRAFT_146607 [Auricularia subglabra TFB-10046 SS5]
MAGGVAPTMGAYMLGIIISVFLVGIATLQAWNYFRIFTRDPLGLKALVTAVYCLELVQTIFLVHSVYHYVIVGFGDYAALEETVWSLEASVLFTGVIAVTVQSFFSLRVRRITESLILALVCWTLALLRFAFTTSIGIRVIAAGSFAVVAKPSFKWQVVASLCFGAASDVAVAGCICGGLMRRKSGFERTDRIVERIMGYTIGSGLMTSIVAVLELITYTTMNNFVWIGFFTILSKMFSNSLLVSLNQRDALRAESVRTEGSSARTNANLSFGRRIGETTVELGDVSGTDSDATRTKGSMTDGMTYTTDTTAAT